MKTYSLFISKHPQGFDIRILPETSPEAKQYELDSTDTPGWYKFEANDLEGAKAAIYGFMRAGFNMLE